MRSILTVVSASVLAMALCANGQPAPQPGVAGLGECFAAESAVVPFSGVVLARHGKQEYFTATGVMDIDTKQPITRDTRFRLASVGKTFTTAAIGLLVMQGKLQLSDSVRKYVPELPADYDVVTIDMLVHHRSGVNPVHMSPGNMTILRDATTAHALLPIITAEPLGFTPGTKTEYSNGGFFLLGVVIESVTGKSYSDYLDQAIFKPLGMTKTGLTADAATAVPSTRMGPPGAPPLDTPRSMHGMVSMRGSPAGDAVSTADDMMRFADAMMGERLLSDAVKEQLFLKTPTGLKIGQAGGAPGTNTDYWVLPASQDVLIVLANLDPPAGELMGQVLHAAMVGQGCKVLRPEDRPSPFKMVNMPPPGGARPPAQ